MTTFEVFGDSVFPDGQRLLTGVVSNMSIDEGDTCQITKGGATGKLVVKSFAMLDRHMVENHVLGIMVQVQPDDFGSLIGCTLNFKQNSL